MALIRQTEQSSPRTNTPKLTLDAVEIKNNYYIVQEGTFNHYFPIRINSALENEHLFRLLKRPPVLMEGIAIVNRKLYFVTLKDLQRGVIRKYRVIGESNNNAASITNAATVDDQIKFTVAAGDGTKTVLHNDEQTVSSEDQVEASKFANSTREEQIRSLLHLISEKEGGEWEIADIAQP